ncbi:MAG: AMP-binding protein [Spirochaetales bacterium]|nr:AMP-binding protein [Spirochaetales bacterium]
MIERNFVDNIQNALREHWDRPCFSNFEEDTYSYKEIAASILAFHEVYKKSGLKKGDKVAVCGKNSVNWVKVYLATVTYGAVIVPVMPDFNAEDITNIINHSDSKFFFAPESMWKDLDFEKLSGLMAGLEVDSYKLLHKRGDIAQTLIEDGKKDLAARLKSELKPEDITFDKVDNAELAAILYTSGTTGFSKGVMLNHNCLIANVDYAQKSIGLKAGDPIVSFLPVAHCFGGAFEFLFPFLTGCHISFLSKRVAPQIIMKAFQTIHPRLILSVPLVIEKVYHKQLKPILNKWFANIPGIKQILGKIMCKKLTESFGGNFIAIVIGGAAFNPEVEAFLKRVGFRFTVGYGMTECGPLISYSPWDQYRGGSAGKLMFHLEGKIDSPDPQNELGEIMVKGENVMLGYYKNEEATREVLSEDGWLRTGDMGVMDADQHIYIKGRCKNMLLSPAGQNIYPEELEAKLNNYGIITEALVLDREHKVVGLVYLDQEYIKEKGLDEAGIKAELEEVRKDINRILPSYSQILYLEPHAEEFIKTPTMKIRRFNYK